MTNYVSVKGLGSAAPRWSPPTAVRCALSEAKHESKSYGALCDHFVARCYGFYGSGHYSAKVHWDATPKQFKHFNHNVPVGGLVYWDVGTYGHIAICVRPGYVASNDIVSYGKIDVVPISYITNRWGARYLGWTNPYYPNGWGENPDFDPTPPEPAVDLSKIRRAAKGDPSYRSYEWGTKKVQRALKAEKLLIAYLPGRYGGFTRRGYSKWQTKLGYKGNDASGIPGKESLAKLGNRHGFKVKE